MKYKQADLKNGGKLFYIKNKINNSTLVEIAFDCGSRCDTIPGLTHFTEHMFFAGTKTLTKEQITKKYFDFINVNAGTGTKGISFDGQIFTRELKDYLSTVAELITKTDFSKKNIDKEIPVVQQEIARDKDNFKRHCSWLTDYLIFGEEVFKNTTLGNKKSVASITSKDVKSYVDKYFHANNLEVYICSPLSLKKVKKLVIKHLEEKLEVKTKFTKLPYHYLKVQPKNFYQIETKPIEKNYVNIIFKHTHNRLDFNFIRKFSLVLDMINDYSEGMLNNLRLKKSLVYNAILSSSYFNESGIVGFRTECDTENINDIFTTLADYFKNLLKTGFTPDQLKKAKRLYDFSEETKEIRLRKNMQKLYDFKDFGKIINPKETKKVILSTTLEECNALLREVFTSPDVSALIYGAATKQDVMTKAEFINLFK